MAAISIYVSRVKGTDKIKFHDSEGNNGEDITTIVNPDDFVIWEIAPKANDVYQLIAIEKSGGDSLLQSKPASVDSAFVGRIKSTGTEKDEIEDYTVYYQLDKGGPVRSQDPKLKMNK